MSTRLALPLRLAAGALATVLLAGPAVAQSIRAAAATDNWIFTGLAQQVVPGMTTRAFPNGAGARFFVTFSAECAVRAPTTVAAGNAWLDVDIVVLDATGMTVVTTLVPTLGSGDALCSSTTRDALSGWTTASVTAVGGDGLPVGNYRIQVRARLNSGAAAGWLGERLLNVHR